MHRFRYLCGSVWTLVLNLSSAYMLGPEAYWPSYELPPVALDCGNTLETIASIGPTTRPAHANRASSPRTAMLALALLLVVVRRANRMAKTPKRIGTDARTMVTITSSPRGARVSARSI